MRVLQVKLTYNDRVRSTNGAEYRVAYSEDLDKKIPSFRRKFSKVVTHRVKVNGRRFTCMVAQGY